MTKRLYILAIVLGITIGMAVGVGGYTFFYAEGLSYLSNDPKACANCHIMNEQYDSWTKSPHHHVAVCNDCHAPHTFVGKYMTKAINGYNHSLAFTTDNFYEPIRITPRNHEITEQACRYCHSEVVQAIDPVAEHAKNELSCIRCHKDVGHY